MDRTFAAFWMLLGLLGAGTGAAVAAGNDRAAVIGVLDGFHAAAAEADEGRYFGYFTTDAVFLGTDARERWTVARFREYARPHFEAGRGWAYRATERHVMFSDDRSVAWFDEKLHNDGYGTLRGTGVLRKTPDGWRIAHYSLTFLIPNEVSAEVVKVIRLHSAPAPHEPSDAAGGTTRAPD